MSKLFDHPKALCEQVKRIALEAGELVLDYFDEAGFTDGEIKRDGSPVTIADQEAEKLITKHLNAIDATPVVGEEAVAAGQGPDITGASRFWLVDALDGTKSFINGDGDFTVNIGLIVDGVPSLGVVYAPHVGELYAGFGTATATRMLMDTGHEKNIHIRKAPATGLTVVSSKSHGNAAALESYLADYKVAKLLRYSSSLKICAIAAGKADIYPRLGPTCEWDIGAAHAVLLAAGGRIEDIEGNAMDYGRSDRNYLNPHFVAKGDV